MSFQKTVNLKKENKPKKTPSLKKESIDRVYEGKDDLQKIDKLENQSELSVYKKMTFVLFIILVGFLVYSFVLNKNNIETEVVQTENSGWYMVKLINDDVFYGQIQNDNLDPIVLDNVYYDYDQIKDGSKEISEVGNKRLVKRGKETHGPSGTMEIYKEKILYKEILSKDSKVLQAILNYEK
ncbi:hypothetical protein KAI92_04370 [Candidatus Parcubacteria bacterium]|nr:hypothetical protein [Candidatus Parcubacteria bacterium]